MGGIIRESTRIFPLPVSGERFRLVARMERQSHFDHEYIVGGVLQRFDGPCSCRQCSGWHPIGRLTVTDQPQHNQGNNE